MSETEIPSDEQVVAALAGLGGHATAVALFRELAQGHPVLQSQIAIQRAADRGKIVINRDWTLSIPVEAEAA